MHTLDPGIRGDRNGLPPMRVLAFEHELDYWLSRRGVPAPPVRVSREAAHLRIEVGSWSRPYLVGRVSYEAIQAAADWRALAAQVSRCRPGDPWWMDQGPAGSLRRG